MCKALYLHVPFCRGICAYCDFTRCNYYRPLAIKWWKRIEKDLDAIPNQKLHTIYIGGGTPSCLDEDILGALLCKIRKKFSDVEEYTIEANVESLSESVIDLFVTYGIDRVSLGVQSMQEHLLKIVERKHRKEDVIQAITQLKKKGISNISIDLMYGLPTQTKEDWQKDLNAFLQLDVPHISLYALTIEEHSTFGRNQIQSMDEDLEADLYEVAIAFLKQHGYEQYEISNFAKAGKQSLHNLHYWNYDDFYGVGCGASGKEHHVRYDNTHNLHTYITEGASPEKINLSEKDEMFEMLMMGLRLQRGVSLRLFEERFHQSFDTVYGDVKETLIKRGMLKEQQGFLRTTKHGKMLLHDVLTAFL